MCLHVRLLCDALWWPLLMRCARAARTYDDDYEQVCQQQLSVHFRINVVALHSIFNLALSKYRNWLTFMLTLHFLEG